MRHAIATLCASAIAVAALPRRMQLAPTITRLVAPSGLAPTPTRAPHLARDSAIALPSPARATDKKDDAAVPASHVYANGFHRCRRLSKGQGIDGDGTERLS